MTLQEDTDELCFAAIVADVYGRQAVYSSVPYILSQGELTWPDTSDLSDNDPATGITANQKRKRSARAEHGRFLAAGFSCWRNRRPPPR